MTDRRSGHSDRRCERRFAPAVEALVWRRAVGPRATARLHDISRFGASLIPWDNHIPLPAIGEEIELGYNAQVGSAIYTVVRVAKTAAGQNLLGCRKRTAPKQVVKNRPPQLCTAVDDPKYLDDYAEAA